MKYLNLNNYNLIFRLKGINIYIYEQVNGQLSTNSNRFSNINKLSNYLGVVRQTLNVYLNRYVPYKNNLFLTNKIESYEFA